LRTQTRPTWCLSRDTRSTQSARTCGLSGSAGTRHAQRCRWVQQPRSPCEGQLSLSLFSLSRINCQKRGDRVSRDRLTWSLPSPPFRQNPAVDDTAGCLPMMERPPFFWWQDTAGAEEEGDPAAAAGGGVRVVLMRCEESSAVSKVFCSIPNNNQISTWRL
jgi:hypothetical protein